MHRLVYLAVIATILISTFARAEIPAPQPIQYTEQTLPNGLRVIYAPLHQAPVVHVRVLYHVGSRDERRDRQGFAHMFEHMMFRGSAHVAPEEHMKRVGTVGGISNAFTSFDATVYHNTVPSQYLEMVLWLEADRMSSFKVSEEIYKTERNVVAEEWRMRHNQPYATMFEDYLKKAFVKHSYQWTPIGNMAHLRSAPVSELQEFFNSYYVPNNAILVIGGDFDIDAAKEMVKRFFGWIPKGAQVPRRATAEPEQTEARVAEDNEPVPLPAVMIGYTLPAYTSDDHYALDLLSSVLGDGDSSRLQRTIVHGEHPIAVQAYAMHMPLQDYGVFGVGGVVLKGKNEKTLEDALTSAVGDVVSNGITADELAKVKNQKRISLIHDRETAENLATQLGDESLFGDDANRVNTALAKYDAVTLDDVKRVAAKYLVPQRATTLRVQPSMAAAASIAKANKEAAAMKNAPVVAATEPIKPRVVSFPSDYPTTAPTALPRPNPPFAQGTESDLHGVKVIVMPDSRLPLVNFSLILRRGSQSDPMGKEGTAWLTDEMLHRGVQGLDFNQLSSDLDSRGIDIQVGDGGDNTRLSAHCTSDQLDHAIERSRQILRTPTFPPDEFARLKEQSINSLRLGQENPNTIAANELLHALYGNTVLGRYSTPESVQSISLDDVKAFYQTIYKPTEAIFIISGDVTLERGRELAAKLVLDWPAGELPPVDYKLPEAPSSRTIILVDRPESAQATVRMGIRAYDIHSNDKFAGSVAGNILSSGIESRLMKYVRAEKGLCYSVVGYFDPNRQAGVFQGQTDTKVETTADAIEAMFKVFSDMSSANVKPPELADAQQRVSGRLVMGMQTIAQQAQFRGDGILNDYPVDYYDKYPGRIAQVTADEVRSTLAKYVDQNRIAIIVVAPAAAVKDQLQRLGAVQVIPMPARRHGSTTQPSQELLKKAA